MSINAESDALGGNPSGFVDLLVQTPFGQALTISGGVTCLGVDGNRAVIGFVDTFSGFGPLTVVASGNNPLGSQQDRFIAFFGATDCSSIPEVPLLAVFGGIAVRDVPSKDQCKQGGWRNYTDALGQPFSDQGGCITFALGAA